jgi:hypothetical protein
MTTFLCRTAATLLIALTLGVSNNVTPIATHPIAGISAAQPTAPNLSDRSGRFGALFLDRSNPTDVDTPVGQVLVNEGKNAQYVAEPRLYVDLQ